MLDVVKLFEHAVEYFLNREAAVQSLAVTAAMERWIQFELVTLLDARRDALGIAGKRQDGLPCWWIACEYRRNDLWVADQSLGYDKEASHGVAIELKAIHNNKNYVDRVASIRSDLAPDPQKLPPTTSGKPERWGIIVATYVLYTDTSYSTYEPLQEEGRLADAAEYWTRLTRDLGDNAPDAWGNVVPLEVVQCERIANLSTAHYVQSTGCEVKLLLVKSAQK